MTMTNSAIRSLLMILFCLLCLNTGYGQSNIKERVNSNEVQEIANELDYTKTKNIYLPKDFGTPEKKENNAPISLSPFANFVANSLYYALILLAIIVAVGIIIFVFSDIQDNRDIRVVREEGLEEEITDIHDLDLQSMLNNAIKSGNYKMAIRAQFLMILQTMSSHDIINWSKEKTNREYLRETKGKIFHPNFHYAANFFDRAWYGDIVVTQQTYTQAVPLFEDLKVFVHQNNVGA